MEEGNEHAMFEVLRCDKISKALAMDPMTGNVTYLMVALFSVVYTSLNLFRYKPVDATLALGDISGKTNWFKTSLLARCCYWESVAAFCSGVGYTEHGRCYIAGR